MPKRKLKISDLVAREIVSSIAEAGLKPGDVLEAEAAMLERFDVGRASLREALRLLESQGLVNVKPGPRGGPVVGKLDPSYLGRTISLFLRMMGSTYRDLCEFQLLVEPRMAELAARRGDRAKAERLFAPSLGDMDKFSRDPQQILRIAEGEMRFHPAVTRLTGNPVLALVSDAVGAVVSEHMLNSITKATNYLCVAHEEHMGIAHAILAKQPHKARRLMYAHTKGMQDYFRAHIPGMLDMPVEWR